MRAGIFLPAYFLSTIYFGKIMIAIWWAFGNMFFAALNDLVFKCYARKPRSHGFFAAIVGVIWCIVLLFLVKDPVTNWKATLLWGTISGIFSIGGNLLMLDAMRKLDAGVCSTIYRLNLVPAVILAALVLKENISLTQYAGIACACLAVLAFLPRNASMRKEMTAGLIVMLIASLMRAGMGIAYRYGFDVCGASAQVVPVINSLFWVFGGIIYAFTRERSQVKELFCGDSIKKLCGYGILSGALVAGIVLTMAKSLELGQASVVLPIMQMSFLVTGILSVIFMKEKVTFLKTVALLLGITTIILMSR